MSKMPEDSIKTSAAFQNRIKEIIADEEVEGSDEGKKCSNAEFAMRVGVSKTVISNITAHGIIPSTLSLIKSDITNNPRITFSRNSIHVWLKRKNIPAIEYVFQLADFFNVSPDYLLGRTDDRTN